MAARAMWKGVLALKGLRLPVKLYAAAEDRKIHFHLLHEPDGERVEQRLVDPQTDEVVPSDAVRKGYEVKPGVFVVLDHDDLAGLEPEPTRDVEVVQTLPAGAIDEAYYSRPYWLGPDGDHEGYFALVAALRDAGREGVARWVMRKRPYAGALRVHGDHLALIALRHGDEVVPASELAAPAGRALDERELRLAEQLVDALADRLDPAAYHDTYRERVEELVAAKAKGKAPKLARPRARKETASLEKALAASLKRAKAPAKGDGAEDGGAKATGSRRSGARTAKKTAAKKQAVRKKTGARKAAAKETAVKKAGARRTGGRRASKAAKGKE